MFDSLIRPFEDVAASLLGGVAEIIGNTGDVLRASPTDGAVSIPDDLYAKSDVQTEWWYYTGQCVTNSGREFGFELVFFKRRTDLDKIGIVPVNALANPMYFAHFAISDISGRIFRYEHLRSFNGILDVPVVMSERACDITLGPWSLKEIAGKHILHGTLEDGLVFDAVLEPTKPLVLNGENGGGISRKKSGASNHFSFTRMKVDGTILENGRREHFEGTAWMDREYGNWEQTDWDWFSIQFDDQTELMLYQFRSETGEINDESTGTYVAPDGTCQYLSRRDFEIEVLKTWTSQRTGTVYPALWRVRVPALDIEVTVEPWLDDQELDTRGSTMIIYWEGACRVAGNRSGADVLGRAYVELVGYDKSHMDMSLGEFLFGGTIRKIRSTIGI